MGHYNLVWLSLSFLFLSRFFFNFFCFFLRHTCGYADLSQPKKDGNFKKPDENINSMSKHAWNCSTGIIKWEDPKIIKLFSEKNKKTYKRTFHFTIKIKKIEFKKKIHKMSLKKKEN